MSNLAQRRFSDEDDIDQEDQSLSDGNNPFDDESGLGGFKEKFAGDPVAEWLLETYDKFMSSGMLPIRVAVISTPIVLFFLFCFFVSDQLSNRIVFFALMCSIFFIGVSMYFLCWILKRDCGSAKMRDISEAIKEGAEGFFITQYGTIFKLAVAVSILLFLAYMDRSPAAKNSPIHQFVGKLFTAFVASLSFLIGANCSAISGYAGIWVSVRANLRVATAAKKDYNDALLICFRGGAFSAIINVALAVCGISSLYLFLAFVFYYNSPSPGEPIPYEDIPVLLVGFGFGASFVAMFAQLGGGIYTKAADVGADLIGKVEAGIPEDDARNPAVIADLVGDNVGDCAGQCADLFESISAEIISAMILGGALAHQTGMEGDTKAGFILFPLLVHSLDLTVSTIATFFVSTKPGMPGQTAGYGELEDPLDVMKRGYYVSLILALIGLFYICKNFLAVPGQESAYLYFFGCSVVGVVVSFLFVAITQYYTDYNFGPVQSIAKSSVMGHATNIITGLSIGLESTGLPVIVICIAILTSVFLGNNAGLTDTKGMVIGGLYGTAIATMGMFSSGVYVLSMSGFGPIADNAGGIVEMSGGDEQVRDITDKLDAVGNVTKANTKGYSVGSASLACFLLFSAYLDEVENLTGKEFKIINIAEPEVFVGGLLGSMTVFVFSGWAIAAVGFAAEDVIQEVRRQFKEHPGILNYTEKPDYKLCVTIVNKAGLREMIKPGLLAVLSPIVVGLVFRGYGSLIGDNLLGARVTAGFLMFSTSTGILMALFFNNGGGAWDNAKKYIESGHHGGKGSDAHKAAITGDTVGDPCKDTAGPSIHILIKLLSTITLVMVPLYASEA